MKSLSNQPNPHINALCDECHRELMVIPFNERADKFQALLIRKIIGLAPTQVDVLQLRLSLQD